MERGVPAEKVSVVMNVADDTIFHQAAATNLSVGSDGCFRLVYHGNLTYRYGVDLAIRAVNLVRHEIPEIYFHIHGAGESLGSLKRLTDELDLRDHVHFSSDFVPTSELPKVIMQAQVGVVPYRRDVFTDGILPTKLMEYAALGVPAIAARSSAIEAYFDETMVEFFTPGDVQELARCILTLYSDRERLSELAEGAERFNQCHSWSKIGGEYVALVERLSNR